MSSLVLAMYNVPTNASAAKPSYTGTYLDAIGTMVVRPEANVTLQGFVSNATTPTTGVGSVNVSAGFNWGNGSMFNRSSLSSAGGGFNYNVTAPNFTSRNGSLYDIYLTTNATDGHNKTLKVFISNATNVTIVFDGSKPPFSTSTNFTINVSYFFGATALASGVPYVEVFRLNGVKDTTFTITNLSASTSSAGVAQYNITVPSTATGRYILLVDKGMGQIIFEIAAVYSVTSQAKTTSDENRMDYAANSSINAYEMVRYSNGTPYTLNGSDSMTAFVTLSNGTTHSFNLTPTNATTKPGFFNITFNDTDDVGNYQVRFVANISGTLYETRNMFNVRSISARLEPEKTFFREWGGKKIIIPGQTVRFNILAENTSDGTVLSGASNGGSGAVNCSSLRLIGLTNVATSANASWVDTASFPITPYLPNKNVCSLQLRVPSAVGVYRVQVNVTVPGVSTDTTQLLTAEGVVRVQQIDLKLAPIQAQADFMRGEAAFMFTPGENVTLAVQAFNFSAGSRGEELNATLIANVRPLSLRSMRFTGASGTGFTNWSSSNYWVQNVTEMGVPSTRLIVKLPSSDAGFFEFEVEARVAGQTVIGKAFFEAKYVEAHGGPMGGGGGQGFSPFMTCNGSQSFRINAFDIKTRQPAQGVVIQGIREVRHDESGKSFISSLSMNTNTTDSTGAATVNVNFTPPTGGFIDGHYFMLFNISYKGNQDVAYSGFMCQSGVGEDAFGPRGAGIRADAFANPFQVGPDAPVNIQVNNIALYNGTQFSTGFVRITRLRVFSTIGGGETTATALGNLTVYVSGGQAQLQLFPANFSLTSWPIGFVNLVANVTGTSGPGGYASSLIGGSPFAPPLGGFKVEAFRVMFDFQNFPRAMSVGDTISIVVNASTNVSRAGSGGVGENFTVRFMRFGFGNAQDATVVASTLLVDNWNNTNDTMNFSLGVFGGVESWNVSFVVPSGLQTGPTGVLILVNNTDNVASEAFAFTTITALDLRTMTQNEVIMQAWCFSLLDDRNQNGTFEQCYGMPTPGTPLQGSPTPSTYNSSNRLNLSHMNNSALFRAWNGFQYQNYTLESKSGGVCYKPQLNYTQFGQYGPIPMQSLDTDAVALIVDNTTARVYDTLVLNTSNGTVQVITLSNNTPAHRRLLSNFNLAIYNSSALYASSAMDCPIWRFVNATVTLDNYGASGFFDAKHLGFFKKNTVWSVPYRVTRGNTPISGAIANIRGFANMSFGGFGFENMLPSTDYVLTQGTSDSNGVAFVLANVTRSGEFMAFWQVNATISGQYIEEIAKLQRNDFMFGGGAGSMVQIQAFRVMFGQGFNPFQQITSANQNLSYNITAQDFEGRGIPGANVTVSGQVFHFGPPTALTVQLYNASTSANATQLQTGSDGSVNVLFSKSGGWSQGDNAEIIAVVVNATDTERMRLGHVSYMNFQGTSGGGCIPGQPCGPGPGPGP